MTTTNKNDDDIVIYVIPGSQFSFKVLSALTARKIPHYVEFVPTQPEARRKVLPSGGKLVPEMLVGSSETPVAVVPDSEAILHWLDEHRSTNFFFNDSANASELSLRASTRGLAGLVWYYNWVNPDGYKASMQKSLARLVLPSWIAWGRAWIVDALVYCGGYRQKHATMAMQALDIDDESTLYDEAHMKTRLLEELQFFQSLFGERSSSKQPYLLENTTEPTAVDFSVFAQVQRLIGAGAASDVSVYPALPELRQQHETDLGRLWQWYDIMCERFPVKFKGKRLPR